MGRLNVFCLCATSSKNVTIEIRNGVIVGHWKCEICLRQMEIVIHEIPNLEEQWPGEKERIADRNKNGTS